MPRIQNVHIPAELKNHAVNGALDYWQEKLGNTNTINTATTVQAWSADMVKYGSAGPTTKNYAIVRSTNVPTKEQAGFNAPYSMQMTMLTGVPSFAAADYVIPWYFSLEGADYAKLHGKTMTIGFWFFASVTGTYNFVARNGAINRMYVSNFTVSAANTWQYVSFTLPTDSSGTWTFDSSAGLEVLIAGYSGSTYQTATANAWQSGNFVGTSSATNWMAATNAVIRIAMFSICEGSLGFGATGFQRAGKTIQQEIALCQRYYRTNYDGVVPGTAGTGGRVSVSSTDTGNSLPGVYFGAPMRAAPTVTLYNNGTGTSGRIRRYNGATDVVVAGVSVSVHVFHDIQATLVSNSQYDYMFVADARL